jgi:lysozyme
MGQQTEAAAVRYAADALLEAEPADPETEILIAELLRDEGFVPHAYQDSLGYWTIGIGRLIDKRKGGGISRLEADHLKINDIARGRFALDAKIPWWRELDPVRQRAVQNMAFQLGTGDMGGATFNLIRDGQYAEAAKRLRGWTWAKQTPARAGRVIKMIETGKV